MYYRDMYIGHFPFSQKLGKFQNRDKWYGNFLGKFPENPETMEFSKVSHSTINSEN